MKTVIPLNAIVESPTNPRRKFDVTLLKKSMAETGLIHPIVVRRVDKLFEIIDGHRRFRAAKALEWDTIPALEQTADDTTALEMALAANLHAESLTPLEEAEGFAKLRELGGETPEQMAASVGRTKGWVYQRLKLLELVPEARRLLQSGELALSVAIPLARLPEKLQPKALDRVVAMGAREAIEWLQKEFVVSLRNAPFNVKDDMLLEGAPPCGKCPKRSGSGPVGLFDDLDGEVNLCTDVVCFNAKARAAWEEKATAEAKKGAAVLGLAEGRKLFSGGVLTYGAGYVDVDGVVQTDAKRRTWSEVLGEKAPQVVVAPDAELRLHRLYREAEAHAAAAELGAKWARPDKPAKPGTPAAPTKERPDEEAARRVRERVVADVLVGAALKMGKAKDVPPALFVIMATALHTTHAPTPAVTAYLDAVAGGSIKDFRAWAGEASPKALLGYLFVALAEEWCGGTWDGFDEGLEVVAKAFGFNLQQMVADAAKQ